MDTYRFYRNLDDIKQAHEAQGGRFFSPSNIRFWHSKVYHTIYHGCLFVTNDRLGPRRPSGGYTRGYSLRRCLPDGDIVTIGRLGQYRTSTGVVKAAQAWQLEEGNTTHVGE